VKVIVYDFDGTIIKGDSFSLILDYVAKGKFYKKINLLLWRKVYSYKIIDNMQFKSVTTTKILNGLTTEELEEVCHEIVIDLINNQKVNLKVLKNLIEDIYDNHSVIILSATPKEVVSSMLHSIIEKINLDFLPIFKEKAIIIGSNFKWNRNNKLEKFLENCYREKKKEKLFEIGITKLQEFYTDSLTDDLSIAEISDRVFVVQDEKIYEWRHDD
jgi:2-hydroxy-3-keto-5-methylthiopentenyl-1-phosphate phosphatase